MMLPYRCGLPPGPVKSLHWPADWQWGWVLEAGDLPTSSRGLATLVQPYPNCGNPSNLDISNTVVLLTVTVTAAVLFCMLARSYLGHVSVLRT